MNLLSLYCSLGFSPQDYWHSTPREVEVHLKGARQRLEHEHNGRAWLAFHAAYLPRHKKPPKLKTLLVGPRQKPRRQSTDEMIAIAKQWDAWIKRASGR